MDFDATAMANSMDFDATAMAVASKSMDFHDFGVKTMAFMQRDPPTRIKKRGGMGACSRATGSHMGRIRKKETGTISN